MRELIKKIKLTEKEREQARGVLRAAMNMTPAQFMQMVHERELIQQYAPFDSTKKSLLKKIPDSLRRKKR